MDDIKLGAYASEMIQLNDTIAMLRVTEMFPEHMVAVFDPNGAIGLTEDMSREDAIVALEALRDRLPKVSEVARKRFEKVSASIGAALVAYGALKKSKIALGVGAAAIAAAEGSRLTRTDYTVASKHNVEALLKATREHYDLCHVAFGHLEHDPRKVTPETATKASGYVHELEACTKDLRAANKAARQRVMVTESGWGQGEWGPIVTEAEQLTEKFHALVEAVEEVYENYTDHCEDLYGETETTTITTSSGESATSQTRRQTSMSYDERVQLKTAARYMDNQVSALLDAVEAGSWALIELEGYARRYAKVAAKYDKKHPPVSHESEHAEAE